jgi:hypothetical protein
VLGWRASSKGDVDCTQRFKVRGGLVLKRKKAVTVAAAVVWLVACVAGAHAVMRYATAPGVVTTTPATWPHDTALQKSSIGNTLLLFVHPMCPCTKATLSELKELVENHKLPVTVVVYTPEAAGAKWQESALVRDFRQLDNAAIVHDVDGIESRRFGVTTSGHALLYNSADELLYSGGITKARGEIGDNDARQCLQNQLSSPGQAALSQPTFGCPLNSPGECSSESSSCCRS